MVLEGGSSIVKMTVSMASRIANVQTFRVFRHRNFRLLFLSTFAQSVSFFMIMVALGWQVLEMTDSAFLLGMVWAARSAPFLVFGIIAGTIADKVDRRRLLVLTFILLAVCTFLLGLLTSKGVIQLWHIFLITFIMGSIQTFDITTRQAFVFDIVGPEEAMNAIAMNAAAMRFMGIFGGAVAGVVIELFGLAWCFYIIVIAYLLGIMALFYIRGAVRKTSSAQQSVWGNFVEGLKLLGKNQIVLILAVMAIICEILGFSYMVVLPIFARDILNVGVVGLGMLTASASIGGLLAALVLASLGNYKHKGWLILGIFLTFGVFLVLFSQSPWYLVSLIFVGIVGGMAVAMDTMEHTMLQLNVTDEQRGRAMGVWVLSIGFGPVGYVAIGAITTLIGAQLALSINGIAIVAIFFALVVFVPRLRRI